MRKKLPKDEKRSKIIGIKVTEETKKKLEYISDREQTPLSTYLDEVIQDHINNYFKIAKIEWKKIPPTERGEEA